jgi:uncharacterized OB-fold protein
MLEPPPPDADARPHREAARVGRLAMPRCTGCGRLVWYPRPRCPSCHAAVHEWETLSGLGTVYSATVVHRAPDPSLEAAVPYVVALVDLDEGARMLSNIVDCEPDAVTIGMRVAVRFRVAGAGGGTFLPVFAPVETGGDAG